MRVQLPKKRIMQRENVTQTWNESPVAKEKGYANLRRKRDTNVEKSAYVHTVEEVERKTTGKNGRCESTKLSPLANQSHENRKDDRKNKPGNIPSYYDEENSRHFHAQFDLNKLSEFREKFQKILNTITLVENYFEM